MRRTNSLETLYKVNPHVKNYSKLVWIVTLFRTLKSYRIQYFLILIFKNSYIKINPIFLQSLKKLKKFFFFA